MAAGGKKTTRFHVFDKDAIDHGAFNGNSWRRPAHMPSVGPRAELRIVAKIDDGRVEETGIEFVAPAPDPPAWTNLGSQHTEKLPFLNRAGKKIGHLCAMFKRNKRKGGVYGEWHLCAMGAEYKFAESDAEAVRSVLARESDLSESKRRRAE